MTRPEEFIAFDPDAKRQPDKCCYPGAELNVLYERPRCMHAAECGRASKAVFDGKRKQWIMPDQLPKGDLLKVVLRCPTGALRATNPDGTLVEEPVPDKNEVTISPDGPLYIRGNLVVHRPDGTTTNETRVALCRCGTSQYKPFCDGRHSRARFHDAGGVDRDADGPAPSGGTLTIKLADNGPLLLEGPMSIRAASGRVAFVGEKVALCRCGNSANKPFCDGAHKTVGWRSIDGDGR